MSDGQEARNPFSGEVQFRCCGEWGGVRVGSHERLDTQGLLDNVDRWRRTVLFEEGYVDRHLKLDSFAPVKRHK